MNDRLKDVRMFYELSQEEFGNKIGIRSRAHISSLEGGTRNITERIVSDVCREFGISEQWFRTGEGEMFPSLTISESLMAQMGILRADDDESKKRFVLNMLKLVNDDKKFEMVKNFLQNLFDE